MSYLSAFIFWVVLELKDCCDVRECLNTALYLRPRVLGKKMHSLENIKFAMTLLGYK